MEEAQIRRSPLGEYVIFIGEEKKKTPEGTCPFCTENKEIILNNGEVRVVPNINPIFRVAPLTRKGIGYLYDIVSGTGANEIVVESPDHQNWIDMPDEKIVQIFNMYKLRISDLKKWQAIRSLLVYRHFKKTSGIEHPYSTVVASPVTFPVLKKELRQAKEHYGRKERCMFCDIVQAEMESRERIVAETKNFIAIVPFASRTPFEVAIYPKDHETFFEESQVGASLEIVRLIKSILIKLEKVVEEDGWTMTFFSQNTNTRHKYWQSIHADFHWHIEIMPAKDFQRVTGFYINPITPEDTAKILREA